jgi:hypothetical protein
VGRIPLCDFEANVRFGSKADIAARPRNVRFTPESGHRNRHVYHLRRTNSGSSAIFAAIRRAFAGGSRSRQGIEWIDKIAFDSTKLPLQLDESAIGIVDALSQNRSDVDACKLIYC